MACKDLENYAVEQWWYHPGSQKPFNYREIYCQGFLGMPGNLKRQERAKELLGQLIGNITIKDLMNINRDHYEGKPFYHPPHSSAGSRTICSSAARSSQVFHLRGGMPAAVGCVMWIAASSPCTSVYSPVYAGHRGDFPVRWMSGSDLFDRVSAWWVFEKLQRLIAPGKPNPGFNPEMWGVIRTHFDLEEKQTFLMAPLVEQEALRLWKRGDRYRAHHVLTAYTSNCLSSNLTTALYLLDWVEGNGISHKTKEKR